MWLWHQGPRGRVRDWWWFTIGVERCTQVFRNCYHAFQLQVLARSLGKESRQAGAWVEVSDEEVEEVNTGCPDVLGP